MRRTHLRSPTRRAVRAFAISRKQRFELELRSVPESVEVVVLPAPPDDRELFDFSDPGRSSTRRTASPSTPSTPPTRRGSGAAVTPPLVVAPHRGLRPIGGRSDHVCELGHPSHG